MEKNTLKNYENQTKDIITEVETNRPSKDLEELKVPNNKKIIKDSNKEILIFENTQLSYIKENNENFYNNITEKNLITNENKKDKENKYDKEDKNKIQIKEKIINDETKEIKDKHKEKKEDKNLEKLNEKNKKYNKSNLKKKKRSDYIKNSLYSCICCRKCSCNCDCTCTCLWFK